MKNLKCVNSSGALPKRDTESLLFKSDLFFSKFIVPLLLDITGVSLPYLSKKTTPNWYSLSDFIDLLDPAALPEKVFQLGSKEAIKFSFNEVLRL